VKVPLLILVAVPQKLILVHFTGDGDGCHEDEDAGMVNLKTTKKEVKTGKSMEKQSKPSDKMQNIINICKH
jgi:hypothetical protein